MSRIFKSTVLIFAVFFYQNIFSQGCSDAGFCTLENFQGTATDSISFSNSLKFGANIGAADNDHADTSPFRGLCRRPPIRPRRA